MPIDTLAEGAQEPRRAVRQTHLGQVGRKLVAVDQLGVAEDPGCLAEEVLDLPGVHLHLLLELLLAVEERERVAIGFADELAAPCVGERLEEVDHVRAPGLHLVEHHARDGVADLEVALVPPDQVEHQCRRGAIALVCDLPADLRVLRVVEVEGVGVEDGIALEAVRL